MSIFKETFKGYVKRQMRIRESILSQGNNLKDNRFKANVAQNKLDFRFDDAILPPGAFFTYTAERQCMIRMMSGVDLLETNKILDGTKFEKIDDLKGPGLAMRYMLMGGIPVKNYDFKAGRDYIDTTPNPEAQQVYTLDPFGEPGNPDRFVKPPIQMASRGMARKKGSFGKHYSATYGDPYIRSDASEGDDFGIVPMPGIVSANIRTKSAYGSLREAKVEFACHNRRQLEVLELLYMRPGFPILLDWGWSVYFSNDGKKEIFFPSIDTFWDTNVTIEEINSDIIKYKKLTSGNYDGFLGMCKNFEFVARPDGGYDCTTELIGSGEIIESLKGRRSGKRISKVEKDGEEEKERSKKVEVDDLEYYIAAIVQFAETRTKRVSDSSYIQENPYQLSLYADFRKFANDYVEKNDGKIGDYKLTDGEFQALADESDRMDNPSGIFGGVNGSKIRDDIEEIERLIDSYYIYKGEPLFKGSNELEARMASKENYIRWDFFAHILNMFVIDRQGRSENPMLRLTTRYNETSDPLRYTQIKVTKPTSMGTPWLADEPSMIYIKGDFWKQHFKDLQMMRTIRIPDLVDMSVDPLICLLPHQLQKLQTHAHDGSLKNPNQPTIQMDPGKIPNKATGFRTTEGWVQGNREIGNIFLNINHIKEVFQSMRYNDEGLNPNFNLFDYLKKIWDDVNSACAGTHTFTLQSEHERPNYIRVIDLGFQIDSGLAYENLFTLDIQSNTTICREFNFNTTIPNSLSSTIAIAAQNPDSITDLEAASFSALHTDIQSRFFKPSIITDAEREQKRKKYQEDLEDFKLDIAKLYVYRIDVLTGDYTITGENKKLNRISKNKAISIVKGLEAKIISLNSRYHKDDLTADPPQYEGFRDPNYSQGRSEIIPLKFNAKFDGISGLTIGNVFKINKRRLPKGYQGEDIGFIVMGESQNITSGQDWTTEISGQLILLDNPQSLNEENSEYEYSAARGQDNIDQMESLQIENPEATLDEHSNDNLIQEFIDEGKTDILKKIFENYEYLFYEQCRYQLTTTTWHVAGKDKNSPFGQSPDGYARDFGEGDMNDISRASWGRNGKQVECSPAMGATNMGPFALKSFWNAREGGIYGDSTHCKSWWMDKSLNPGGGTQAHSLPAPSFIDWRTPPAGVLSADAVQTGWVNFGIERERYEYSKSDHETGTHGSNNVWWSGGCGISNATQAQWVLECFGVGDASMGLYPGHVTNPKPAHHSFQTRKDRWSTHYEDEGVEYNDIMNIRGTPNHFAIGNPAGGNNLVGAWNVPNERRYTKMTLQEYKNWIYLIFSYYFAQAQFRETHTGYSFEGVATGKDQSNYDEKNAHRGTGQRIFPNISPGTPPSGDAVALGIKDTIAKARLSKQFADRGLLAGNTEGIPLGGADYYGGEFHTGTILRPN